MKRIAIVTGATGGLGKEFVKEMLKVGVDEIWAVARNEEKLATLKDVFGSKIRPISCDLADMKQIEKIKGLLAAENPRIKYLVNNAGTGQFGKCYQTPAEDIAKTIDLNCKAPAVLNRICIPYMGKNSKIINISSASAFQPTPYINIYAASKVFLRSYSRSLNVELEGTGIRSIAVCPGWIDTDLLPREMNGHRVNYPGMVGPDKVARKAMKDVKKGKDMSVYTVYAKSLRLIGKLWPQRLIMKIWTAGIGKYIGEK